MKRNPTRAVRVGSIQIGGGAPIAVQSMAATRTQDIPATLRQVQLINEAGADLIRIAVDSAKDVECLAEIRARAADLPGGQPNFSVDLQENYRLVAKVAPHVDKVRYNPGHLHHHEKGKPVRDKVAFIAEQAAKHDCAIRVGVNCGSLDPALEGKFGDDDVSPIVESALQHTRMLDDLGFTRYVVSLKDSDPQKVIEANERFAALRPEVPIHLGVTEAGIPPEGIIKTRIAFEQLITQGIGDTLRVSLTLPFEQKGEEIRVGRQILDDIATGRFRSIPKNLDARLNIISCPSCSRVENEKFVELALEVKQMAQYAKDYDITIAVMGCRVNGPGETDDADLGLWCAPTFVNLKKGEQELGAFPYDTVLDRLRAELDLLITEKGGAAVPANG
jgi:(E)-4-hydroxy-3-methylbut-2-enyl-diphosphate synthase